MVNTLSLLGFLALLLPAQATDTCSLADPASCGAQGTRSLLQISAGMHTASIASTTPSSIATTPSIESLTRAPSKGSFIQTKHPVSLPPDLVELGTRLFGSTAAMELVVAQSSCGPMTYANVSLHICIATGDNAKNRLPEEDGEGYGLDTLLDLRSDKSKGMINMLDFGGNYGVVTIATSKKYPGKVRAVVAEPVPSTFFFLRWNMYLNGVTVVDETAFRKGGSEAGVVALQQAVSGPGDSVLRICSAVDNSMNSYLSLDSNACKCYDDKTPCFEVPVASSDHMLDMFGSEDITLLKMDCEGCEKSSLPTIANGAGAARVKRLVGELHDPDPSLVQLACKWDNAKFMTAYCSRLVVQGGFDGRVDGPDICKRCTI